MKKKVYLDIACGNGLGQVYTNILKCYTSKLKFEDLGYEVIIGWYNNSNYVSQSILPNFLFDFSQFNCEINYPDTWHQIFDGKHRYFSFGSDVCVYSDSFDEKIEELHVLFSQIDYKRSALNRLPDLSIFKKPFINKNMLDEIFELMKDKNKPIGLHYRVPDQNLTSSFDEIISIPFYGDNLVYCEKIINENNNRDVLFCTNNLCVQNYLTEKYSNVFVTPFTSSLIMCNINNSYGNHLPSDVLIKHTEEILINMISLSFCYEIKSMNTFPSNYVTYAIIHNHYHDSWESKLKFLM